MNKYELYNLVFNDGEEFTDFYFNKRRNKVISFEKIVDGSTIAIVNIVNLNLKCNNIIYKTALITGLCTAPEKRKLGIMQDLLNEVLEKLKADNYQLVILSPANDNYYKKYGFTTLVTGNYKKIKYCNDNIYTIKNATKMDINLLINLYDNVTSNHLNYQFIDKNIILDLIDEYLLEDTHIQIVYKDTIPVGWFIVENNKIDICVLSDNKILNHIKNIDNYKYFEYNKNGEKELFQIKYLDNSVKPVTLNSTFVLNKY